MANREELRRARAAITGERFYSDSELRERESQLQQKLAELRMQYEQKQQQQPHPSQQANSPAVNTAIKVGISGLAGYALGRSIHSVK